MKKIAILLSFCLLVAPVLSACGSNEAADGKFLVYYLDLDGDEIETDYFDPADSGCTEDVDVYLYALSHKPDNSDLRQTIPSSITVNGYTHEGYYLYVDFSEEYLNLSVAEEVLIRGAIVQTLCQCQNTAYVFFTVCGSPLLDGHGNAVGAMSADGFVENADQAINTTQGVRLQLYFASADGTYLVEESRTVYYNTSESLAKLVVEKLIEGPQTEGLQQTIPSATRIITISVSDGVCYVNLDSGFESQNQEITEDVLLFSLVNSLTQLEEIDRVQLAINGETTGKVRYIYDLSDMYTTNNALLNPTQYDINTEEPEVTN